MTSMRTPWLIALLVLLALIVPLARFSDYHLFQLTMVVVYAIAILGLSLLIGFNGQISLGHGAFYAIGAYTTAILMTTWNMPYWLTLPFSAIVCAFVGFLVGLPALRLGGLYLALTTFALAVSIPQILKYKAIEDWTGGVQGLVIDKPEAPFGHPAVTRPVALHLHRRRRGAALHRRLEHRPRPRGARHDGNPRPRHGRRGNGHQPADRDQNQHLRHQRDVHRPGWLPRRDRRAVRRTRQLRRCRCRSSCSSA